MIGGMGERKTLRLVARYAQACNLFPTPELPRKLEVLRAHCEAEGRDYDEIEKTSMFNFDVGANGENVGKTIGRLRQFPSSACRPRSEASRTYGRCGSSRSSARR